MRFTAIIISLFILPLLSAQEINISVVCQDTWPPGKTIPVTIIIEKGNMEGFARFFQDLPQGFEVANVESNGADFYWDNDQVNLVWLKLPAEKTIKFRYLVTPDESLSGSFKIGGRFDYIVANRERKSVEVNPILVKLKRGAEVLEVEEIEKLSQTVLQTDSNPVEIVAPAVSVNFRVQVAIASVHLSKIELEERIGCKLQYDITTLKTGSLYKYQSGSFSLYDDAGEYLSHLKECGVKDAFIVAYKGTEQISVELARSLSK
jgi:hypothetical protein